MGKALLLWLSTYLVLKVVRVFVVAPPGYAAGDATIRTKLLRGEPLLIILTGAIVVPATLWIGARFQRGFELGLDRSADCYGRLGALPELTAVEGRFDGLDIRRAVLRERRAAFIHAESLDLPDEVAENLMAEKLDFHTRRYSALSRQEDRRKMRAESAAVARCVEGQPLDL